MMMAVIFNFNLEVYLLFKCVMSIWQHSAFGDMGSGPMEVLTSNKDVWMKTYLAVELKKQIQQT